MFVPRVEGQGAGGSARCIHLTKWQKGKTARPTGKYARHSLPFPTSPLAPSLPPPGTTDGWDGAHPSGYPETLRRCIWATSDNGRDTCHPGIAFSCGPPLPPRPPAPSPLPPQPSAPPSPPLLNATDGMPTPLVGLVQSGNGSEAGNVTDTENGTEAANVTDLGNTTEAGNGTVTGNVSNTGNVLDAWEAPSQDGSGAEAANVSDAGNVNDTAGNITDLWDAFIQSASEIEPGNVTNTAGNVTSAWEALTQSENVTDAGNVTSAWDLIEAVIVTDAGDALIEGGNLTEGGNVTEVGNLTEVGNVAEVGKVTESGNVAEAGNGIEAGNVTEAANATEIGYATASAPAPLVDLSAAAADGNPAMEDAGFGAAEMSAVPVMQPGDPAVAGAVALHTVFPAQPPSEGLPCSPLNGDDAAFTACEFWCAPAAAAEHCAYCTCRSCGFCAPAAPEGIPEGEGGVIPEGGALLLPPTAVAPQSQGNTGELQPLSQSLPTVPAFALPLDGAEQLAALPSDAPTITITAVDAAEAGGGVVVREVVVKEPVNEVVKEAGEEAGLEAVEEAVKEAGGEVTGGEVTGGKVSGGTASLTGGGVAEAAIGAFGVSPEVVVKEAGEEAVNEAGETAGGAFGVSPADAAEATAQAAAAEAQATTAAAAEVQAAAAQAAAEAQAAEAGGAPALGQEEAAAAAEVGAAAAQAALEAQAAAAEAQAQAAAAGAEVGGSPAVEAMAAVVPTTEVTEAPVAVAEVVAGDLPEISGDYIPEIAAGATGETATTLPAEGAVGIEPAGLEGADAGVWTPGGAGPEATGIDTRGDITPEADDGPDDWGADTEGGTDLESLDSNSSFASSLLVDCESIPRERTEVDNNGGGCQVRLFMAERTYT